MQFLSFERLATYLLHICGLTLLDSYHFSFLLQNYHNHYEALTLSQPQFQSQSQKHVSNRNRAISLNMVFKSHRHNIYQLQHDALHSRYSLPDIHLAQGDSFIDMDIEMTGIIEPRKIKSSETGSNFSSQEQHQRSKNTESKSMTKDEIEDEEINRVESKTQFIIGPTKGTDNIRNFHPVIVGIAGGSGSGKSTLTKAIIDKLGEENVTFITHDNYYKDNRHLSYDDRSNINYDHPESLETELFIEHLKSLKQGQTVNIPQYCYKTHLRKVDRTTTIFPKRIIILDGILIFSDPELLSLMDMKIFVDADDDIRLIRRIQRDTVERQRSVSSIIEQYINTVRPMHNLFVEPSKSKADIIVPAGQGIQTVALEMCVSRLREIIHRWDVEYDRSL